MKPLRISLVTSFVALVATLSLVLPSTSSSANTNNHSAEVHHAQAVHSAHVWHAEREHAAAERRAALARAKQLRMIAVAQRVADCEESGNWHFEGGVFDGGIGFSIANWRQFRAPHDPYWMHDATPLQQAQALFRFVAHYGIALPDQHGVCAGY